MFTLTKEQQTKLDAWVAHNVLTYKRTFGETAEYGAIGGELTYSFTPTGLGVITTVEWMGGTAVATTIDLTEYGDW